MKLIDELRQAVVGYLLTQQAMTVGWRARRTEIRSHFTDPANPEPSEIVELGDYLGRVFTCVGAGNRSQSSLSVGGRTWETLVIWYLNICYVGTPVVAVCGKFIPPTLKEALKVTYTNKTVKADLDVVVFSCPSLRNEPALNNVSQGLSKIDQHVRQHLANTAAIIGQTKTNWKDAVQKPMRCNASYDQV